MSENPTHVWFVGCRSTFLSTHPSKNQLRAKPLSLPPIYQANFFSLTPALEKQREHIKCAVRKQRSVFFQECEETAQVHKCGKNSLQRRERATAIVSQHRHLSPHSLSSHSPCTAESTGRNNWQYTLTANSCQTQHGSAVSQGHGRIIHRGKSFKMHPTLPPSSQFYHFHCQYNNKGKEQLSTHRNSTIKKVTL